jgi:DNA-binding LytR/AlgR family response regulator
MRQDRAFLKKMTEPGAHVNGHKAIATNTSLKVPTTGDELIRFEEKRGIYIWVKPEDILFVKTADHYVKTLIKQGQQKKWAIRHGTLKDLLTLLPHDHFIRLNKFYMLNLNHFIRSNENHRGIYLQDDFFVAVPHRISPYVLELLKKIVSGNDFTK